MCQMGLFVDLLRDLNNMQMPLRFFSASALWQRNLLQMRSLIRALMNAAFGMSSATRRL